MQDMESKVFEMQMHVEGIHVPFIIINLCANDVIK